MGLIVEIALLALPAAGLAAGSRPRITYFGLPSHEVADSIVSGPDGALWFTASGQSTAEVGRITTSGSVTSIRCRRIPTRRACYDVFSHATTGGYLSQFPDALTLGPDGNLWITFNSAQIGRLSPSAVVSPQASSGKPHHKHKKKKRHRRKRRSAH